jgi:tetratricopeptide (TPR) repeat protein
MARMPPPSPDDPAGVHTEEVAQLKIYLRKFDEAEKAVRSDAREIFSWGEWNGEPKSLMLGRIYLLLDDATKATAAFEAARGTLETTLQEKPRDAGQRMFLAETYARLGHKEDAVREAKQAAQTIPESKDAWLGIALQNDLARIYVILGEIDLALPIIEHSLATPAGFYANELRLDPFWDVLHGNPRFERLLAQAAEPTKIE